MAVGPAVGAGLWNSPGVEQRDMVTDRVISASMPEY